MSLKKFGVLSVTIKTVSFSFIPFPDESNTNTHTRDLTEENMCSLRK